MKRTDWRWAALLILPAFCGCAGNSFESLRKQQVATVKEAVETMALIHDGESAAKARPKLKKLGDQWRDLEKRMDTLPAQSAAEAARAKNLTDELNGLIGRYLTEALRVAFVPGGKEALNEIGEVKKKR